MPTTYWEKDPRDLLDYEFDFAALTNGSGTEDFLEAGESLASYTARTEGGIIIADSTLARNDTAVRLWLSGGRQGRDYTITVRVVTSSGRVAVRSIVLRVRIAEARG